MPGAFKKFIDNDRRSCRLHTNNRGLEDRKIDDWCRLLGPAQVHHVRVLGVLMGVIFLFLCIFGLNKHKDSIDCKYIDNNGRL